jgi:hypothetical protein
VFETLLIGPRSDLTIVELRGMHSLVTFIHPPYAAHRSITLEEVKKLYLRLSFIIIVCARAIASFFDKAVIDSQSRLIFDFFVHC